MSSFLEILLEIINQYNTEILASLSIITFLLIIISFSLIIKTSRIKEKYKRIMRGNDGKTLESLINDNLDKIDESVIKLQALDQNQNVIQKRLEGCIQNVSVIRYNAFETMGSDQSYSVALLNNQGDGAVITGIFGRDASVSYSKPIVNGNSSYPLSKEEKTAIFTALKKED